MSAEDGCLRKVLLDPAHTNSVLSHAEKICSCGVAAKSAIPGKGELFRQCHIVVMSGKTKRSQGKKAGQEVWPGTLKDQYHQFYALGQRAAKTRMGTNTTFCQVTSRKQELGLAKMYCRNAQTLMNTVYQVKSQEGAFAKKTGK